MHYPVGYWVVLAFLAGVALGTWAMWALDNALIREYEALVRALLQMNLPSTPL